MAYLGNDLQVAFPVYRNIDDISGSFNSVLTTFPLTVSGVAPVPAPLYSQQCLISVGGVVQRPDDSGTEGFRLSGSNIIFASAPTTGADFFGVILAGADYINAGANFPSGSAAVPSITFDSDLDTGIYNSGANQVSITTSGTERLRIDSAGQIESVSLGTAAAPAFSFTTDPNTGIYSPGADQVAISTGGSGQLFVDSNGRTGLGTATPDAKLHCVGQSTFTGSLLVNAAARASTGSSAFIRANNGFSSATTPDYSFWFDDDCGMFHPTGDTLALTTNGSERLRITSAGLVGVGTTSPGLPLHVIGTIGTTPASSNSGFLLLSGNSGAAAGCTIESSFTSGGYGPLLFKVNNGEAARIDSSGRLLVGTSSAPAPVAGFGSNAIQVVNQSAYAGIVNLSTSNDAFGPHFSFGKSRGGTSTIVQNNDNLGSIRWGAADGTDVDTAAALIEAYVDGTPGANDMPGRLVFSTTADGASSPTERMRITNDGKLYFACTADPSSTIKGGAYIGSAASPYFSSSAGTSTSTYTHFYFINGNGTVGSISTSGSATAYNTSSDYRLKENVTVVTDGITRLQQLKPSRFNFIADPTKTVDGFIAHEVQSVVPEAITGEKDAVDDDGNPIYQGIDQSKLVPLLTAALQEAIGEIESLKARVAALESA